MKNYLRPYYVRRQITKDEYKDIMRRAVPRVKHYAENILVPHADYNDDYRGVQKPLTKLKFRNMYLAARYFLFAVFAVFSGNFLNLFIWLFQRAVNFM
jgi:hypothetical protein